MQDLLALIGDLPLHPLAVHFAVVLFPIGALAMALAAMWPWFRSRYLGASVIATALTLPLVYIAQESGVALVQYLYKPEPHSLYGVWMIQIALVTTAIGVLFWLSIKFSWIKILSGALGFLLVSAAIGATAMTFVVGHSGAEATWGGKVTGASTETEVLGTVQDGAPVITQSQVLEHTTLDDCWANVDGIVYDLSDYGASHPGGREDIAALCGTDATATFSAEHGFTGKPANVLAGMAIGSLEAGAELPAADIVYGEGDDEKYEEEYDD